LESFLVWYTTEDSFIKGVACDKKWGAQKLNALEFEKWGEGLEPSSLTEVYAHVHKKKFKIQKVSHKLFTVL